jgi:chemotaxis protein methyltransferase CheR
VINLRNVEDAEMLAQAIVNTIHDPLLVLDDSFHVRVASRSFYETFKVHAEGTQGRLLYSLGNGQWDIPALRLLLETVLPARASMDGFEVEANFPLVGRRTMLLNAREVILNEGSDRTILLAFTDITARRAIERQKDALHQRTEELLRQKEILLQEMQHRVANSLQIIASILLLKARAVTSEETRRDLQDAHQRVMSVAEVQRHLSASEGVDQIEAGPYLTTLCSSLASSMIGDQPISMTVVADKGMIGSNQAVSLGLIVTELVINSIKYAFPISKKDGAIDVRYRVDGENWALVISDNGIGKDVGPATKSGGGLGTAIVHALVKQLGAIIVTIGNSAGTSVSISRTDATSSFPDAA